MFIGATTLHPLTNYRTYWFKRVLTPPETVAVAGGVLVVLLSLNGGIAG
jgi:hypothetical protein